MSEMMCEIRTLHRRADAQRLARGGSVFRAIVAVGRVVLLGIVAPDVLRKTEAAMTRRPIGELA